MNRNENFPNIAKRNSDWLIGLLKQRLQSSGKAKSVDKLGNITYIDADIFDKDVLEAFIDLAVSEFNQTPYFTFFTLEDSSFVDVFADILVEGATLYALSSKALIERGREFSIDDNGLSFAPPSMAEMLNTQFSTMLSHHYMKLKHIKDSITAFKK
jgi:hypothetical protein